MQSHHDMTWLCIQPCIYDIFPVQGQTQNNKISPRLLITPRFVYLQANDKCVLKFVVYIFEAKDEATKWLEKGACSCLRQEAHDIRKSNLSPSFGWSWIVPLPYFNLVALLSLCLCSHTPLKGDSTPHYLTEMYLVLGST